MKNIYCCIAIFIFTYASFLQCAEKKQTKAAPPRVTVVFIVDALSSHAFDRISHNFTGGFRFFLQNSTQYTQAKYPHGLPETAVGHSSLSTGALPKDHGWISNKWFTPENEHIACDADNRPGAAVLHNNTVYDFGRSPQSLQVDTLSDQLRLNSIPKQQYDVYSVSGKSRSAIAMAGNLGKAFWFDQRSGNMTSSKFYYDQLPQWAQSFNVQKNLSNMTSFTWSQARDESAYHLPYISDYQKAAMTPIIGTDMSVDKAAEKPYRLFLKTPCAQQLMNNFALQCLKMHLPHDSSSHLVLFVCLSSLDKIGHSYGPQAKEYIDMMYHIDTYIDDFIKDVYSMVDPKQALFVLTSDHGISPIYENVRDQGIPFAGRTNSKTFIAGINQHISKRFGVDNIVQEHKQPNIYLNHTKLKKIPLQKQHEINDAITEYLRNQSNIIDAFTYTRLESLPLHRNEPRAYLQNQLFPHRSGDIIYLIRPYNNISNYDTGTTHATPYNYDTNIPIMLYQQGCIGKKIINSTVYPQQLTTTLVQLLQTQPPSAAYF
jgi:predicted AlkP superfamily pyrophosphatase or phosphodiesterase